jgi:acetylglutamate kinase
VAVSPNETSGPSLAIHPVVVKLGGEVVKRGRDPDSTLTIVCSDIAGLLHASQPVVVVHGGGPQVSELQNQLGQAPRIVGGRRVTDALTLDAIKMAVAGLVNVDLCSALLAAGARPIGLHGASSGAVRAHRRPPFVVSGGGPDPIDFGFVGDMDGINEELFSELTSLGYVPVVACLGADGAGNVYNINADTVANQMAAALSARALVLVTDVPGVLRVVTDESSRIERMTSAEAKEAILHGVVTKGMIPKLEESFAAIAQGVRAVHIVGRLSRGHLIREIEEPGSVGTVLVP